MLKLKSGRSSHIQDLILLHFLMFSLGGLKLNWFVAQILYYYFHFQPIINQLCDWIAPLHNDKLIRLLFYGLSLFTLFVCYAGYVLTIFCINKQRQLALKLTDKQWQVYCIGIVILNGVLVLFPSIDFLLLKKIFIPIFCFWFFCFLGLPLRLAWPTLSNLAAQYNSKLKLSAVGCWVLTGLVIGTFLSIFYPIIFKPLQIPNDFMTIPEKTLLSTNQVVDNTQYINQQRIGGLELYDPRQVNTPTSTAKDIVTISIPKTAGLKLFLAKYTHNLYVYDDGTQTLSLKGKMKERDYKQLLSIYSATPAHQEAIHRLYNGLNQNENFYSSRIYSAEEQAFIDKNIFEFAIKAKAGWFFFHHSWVLNPILAWSMGADPKQQTFIYGWGSALFLKTLLTHLQDGISFQNYFKWTFIFYPIYFLSFLMVIYGIFRRSDFVCVGAILLSISVFLLGQQMIQLAPGYNPMRHMFDIFVILLFFLYLKHRSIGYLLSSLLVSFLAIVWSKDFGLFLILSLCATGIIQNLSLKKRTNSALLIFFIGALLGLALYFLPSYGVNHNLIYMLLGYALPGTSIVKVCFVLLLINAVYIFYLKYITLRTEYFWLAVCLFFYVQLQLIYYIWYPSLSHLLVSSASFVLLGMSWTQMFLPQKKPGLGLLSCMALSLLYGASLLGYAQNKKSLVQNFNHHVMYDWSFPAAGFQTTMDPQLFKDSIGLIQQYSQHKRSIYLLSKYDAILPVLAQKYNALPVVNLALDLISQRDIERCVKSIQINQPQFLFIDTDILRDYRTDVFSQSDSFGWQFYTESRRRYAVLKNMSNLYAKIINEYEPVAAKGLLTVFQRKEH